MQSLILLLLAVGAVVAAVFFLNKQVFCPHCGGKNVVPKAGDSSHGFGTEWECLSCSKTFLFLPLVSHRPNGGDKT